LFDAARGAGMASVVTFGESIGADFRVIAYSLGPLGSKITALTPVGRVNYAIASPGKHWVVNSLGVLAAVFAAGGDVARAAESLAQVTPPSGRGERFEIALKQGSFTLIDDSYNASPTAMRASLAVLGAQPVEPACRRIAVLGDMLELGEDSPRLHGELAVAVLANNIDTVFLVGEAMANLWEALPQRIHGHHSVTAELLADVVVKAVRPGDVVMVKGSAGSRMGLIANRLKKLDHHSKGKI
jgi:UDP-N-acetylmuramoyl-tripeptide--D-alanyl-D-alanine ligase